MPGRNSSEALSPIRLRRFVRRPLGTLFDPASYDRTEGAFVGNDPQRPNGVLRASLGQIPRGMTKNPSLALMPRLNFSWDVRADGRWILRGAAVRAGDVDRVAGGEGADLHLDDSRRRDRESPRGLIRQAEPVRHERPDHAAVSHRPHGFRRIADHPLGRSPDRTRCA